MTESADPNGLSRANRNARSMGDEVILRKKNPHMMVCMSGYISYQAGWHRRIIILSQQKGTGFYFVREVKNEIFKTMASSLMKQSKEQLKKGRKKK